MKSRRSALHWSSLITCGFILQVSQPVPGEVSKRDRPEPCHTLSLFFQPACRPDLSRLS